MGPNFDWPFKLRRFSAVQLVARRVISTLKMGRALACLQARSKLVDDGAREPHLEHGLVSVDEATEEYVEDGLVSVDEAAEEDVHDEVVVSVRAHGIFGLIEI